MSFFIDKFIFYIKEEICDLIKILKKINFFTEEINKKKKILLIIKKQIAIINKQPNNF